MSAEREVRAERTGWRDMELSNRHRTWGFNCPAVDLDFLMVEYNLALPVAIVEYKDRRATMPNLKHPTYRAICTLADLAGLPFAVAFYWPGLWAFRVYPVNDNAKGFFGEGEDLSEREFVERLYYMRSRVIQSEVFERLNTTKPPVSELWAAAQP